MTESGTRIVIRHLSGSKVNQIDQFDLAGLQEITLGRDPKSTIAFDVQRDDAVSRRHAVIRIKNDNELYFRIADLNSSNGTMLNGERIGGEVELLPDDIVELGTGGPRFTFDVQPRPASLPSRTRTMAAIDAAATRVVATANAEAEAATAERSAVPETQERVPATTGSGAMTPASSTLGRPVGKSTILRMLSDERRSSRQTWLAALAAVVVLAIAGGGIIWWHSQNVAAQLQQQVAAASRALRGDPDRGRRRPVEIHRHQAGGHQAARRGHGLHPQPMAALRPRHRQTDLSEDGQGRRRVAAGHCPLGGRQAGALADAR